MHHREAPQKHVFHTLTYKKFSLKKYPWTWECSFKTLPDTFFDSQGMLSPCLSSLWRLLPFAVKVGKLSWEKVLPYFLDHSPSKKFCGMPAQCSTCPPRNALYLETWPSISTLPGTGKVYQRGPPNDAYQQPQWHIPICLTSSCVKHSFRAWTLRIRLRRLVAQLTSPTIRYGQ